MFEVFASTATVHCELAYLCWWWTCVEDVLSPIPAKIAMIAFQKRSNSIPDPAARIDHGRALGFRYRLIGVGCTDMGISDSNVLP